jgi:transcriptional regulator
MYVPPHFAETRPEVLHRVIRQYPFATLVTLGSEGLTANHLPMEIDPDPAPFGTLLGHVARANPVWRDFAAEQGALAIFQGPQAYVSPSWYPTKRQTGKVVPTWNYVVVHASGPLKVIDDPAWLRAFVERLTNRHEGSRTEPWRVTDAPADYVAQLVRAIVGIELPIARLTGKWKLSQNRSRADQQGVAESLNETGRAEAIALAALMRQSERQ